MKKQLTRILLFGGSLILFCSTVFAQDDTKTRSITSDDFASQRPAGKTVSAAKRNSRARRATYKYVRQDKKVVRRKNVAQKPQFSKPEKVSEVGVTMWKLRPSRTSDAGYKLPVLVNNLRQMWTAERVNADTPFQAGDRIRLAIESSVSGYLYVINSEIYKNGMFGEPYLIFPASETEDNSVQPGLLVDIPDQREEFPYFIINPKNANYAGELLTVIVSPKPLTNLKTDKDGKIRNLDDLIDLEINAEAEIFSRSDAQDKIYTQTEANAACGAKTRQLTREKSPENPCGAKTRQLTREEPLPQTIYRVKTAAGQPAVAFISLQVSN